MFTVSAATPGIQAERRIRQFVQHWFQLMETSKPDPERFQRLLSQGNLVLGFRGPGTKIRSFPDFSDWVRQQHSRLEHSQHQLENLEMLGVVAGRIKVRLDLGWQGKNQAGIQMAGKLRHEWDLLETGEPFLRLEKATVTMLVPVEVWR